MKNMLCVTFLIWSATLALGAAGDTEPVRNAAAKDLAKLQGVWVMISMEAEGESVAAEEIKGRTTTYEADSVTLRSGDTIRRRGIVTLNPNRKPKAINTWDLDGPYEDSTVPGIYEIENDRLKLCFSRPGKERPTAFTTKAGAGVLYVVYERKKP